MCQRRNSKKRRGTTAVEAAIVLPVFLLFLLGMFEYGRMVMMNNALKAACRQVARYGLTEGVSSADANQRVQELLASTMDVQALTVLIKDASVFDNGGDVPLDGEDIVNMPDIELIDADERQLFCIHASVNYNSVAMLPLPFTQGILLAGTSYARHE